MRIIKSKKGGFSDLFIVMILSLAIVFICGLFIFIGGKVTTGVMQTLGNKTIGNGNTTTIINESLGKVNQSYQALYWISVFLIIGMILSVFIGSYLVTTKPIFFIPYIFILIIAIIVAVVISNAYEQVLLNPDLASTFAGFVGANFIMLQLPLWIAIVGIVGGIIMFARMGSNDQQGGGY
jgi:MFS family permease